MVVKHTAFIIPDHNGEPLTLFIPVSPSEITYYLHSVRCRSCRAATAFKVQIIVSNISKNIRNLCIIFMGKHEKVLKYFKFMKHCGKIVYFVPLRCSGCWLLDQFGLF